MIRTAFFDMGNVLVHFSHERMCEQIGALCRHDGPAIRELLFGTGLQLDFERGLISEAEMHARLESATGRTLDFQAAVRAASDIFRLNEPILPVLDVLRSQGIRLVLLSNTSVSHLNWVRQEYDILQRFDHLVTSCDAGAVKPEPAIFKAALAAAHCDPHEAFYTDDIVEYIETARTYGIDAEVFIDTPTLIGHLQSRGLDLGAE